MSIQGTILNIQRYTLHDGPGIRTELFFKGCPLHCPWCSNPESQNPYIEVGVYPGKCIGSHLCGYCMKCCSNSNNLIFEKNQLVAIDRKTCTNCTLCSTTCPTEALKIWGKLFTVEKTMEIIRRDIHYYENSGGGVTFSGGEPLVQIEFLLALLNACKQEHIHTCVESTFYFDWNRIAATLPDTDLYIVDLKHMNSILHQQYTGVPNTQILENITRLADTNKPFLLRIPVIPTVNDTWENMKQTADFIQKKLHNRILQLQLLPFMRLGEEKYKSLGLPYPMAEKTFPMEDFSIETFHRETFQEKLNTFTDYFNRQGINCIVGTTTQKASSSNTYTAK